MLPGQLSGDKYTLHYLTNLTFAAELQACYQECEDGLARIDILKATGTDLEKIVTHVLIDGRQLGDKATGLVTFRTSYEAPEDIPIPEGTQVYSILEDGTKLYFETTEDGTIEAGEMETTINAQAVLRGPSGNIAPYSIVSMKGRITGISSVENMLEFTGGTEDESDDDLRRRYFDAVQAPGKATILMLERSLNELVDVAEARVYNYGEGDLGVLVDYRGGGEDHITTVSQEIVDCLRKNIAVGTHVRGVIGATCRGETVTILEDDVYGGYVWVRPRDFVPEGDTLYFTYMDMFGHTRDGSCIIPPATHRGVMIQASLEESIDRAKKILSVTPSGSQIDYDLLLGMGEAGYLYNLPELININILAQIRLTDTPETDLVNKIKASLEAFLDSFVIGESLQYSDVQKFIQNNFDLTAEGCVGRALQGIDEIVTLNVFGGGQTATKNGDHIVVEEDWRIEAGDVDIYVTD
ncbi:MAG: Baseplate J-like protein [Methanosaeta sp. PtaU1.Bin060]|nr:MAG: Baseplate J-like protein [Methanosaeta sp. PtaU1.Bin060]